MNMFGLPSVATVAACASEKFPKRMLAVEGVFVSASQQKRKSRNSRQPFEKSRVDSFSEGRESRRGLICIIGVAETLILHIVELFHVQNLPE